MRKRVVKEAKEKTKTKKAEKEKAKKPKIITIAGKKKTAIAKATIREGKGEVRVNKKLVETFDFLKRLSLLEPVKLAQDVLKEKLSKVDIDVNVKGGGNEAQIEAARLAIARALLAYSASPELKAAYLNYDRSLLVADVRRKEMYKPGDSKARAKRQKSYR